MKTEWDYTALADAYLKRADYAESAIDAMLATANVNEGSKICDIGAGVAHLTLMLAVREMEVVAVEPNDAMRKNGAIRTQKYPNVLWSEGTGEETAQLNNSFDMTTFGSSFNVCNRELALVEAARILKPGGWFACMWNHRQLDDAIQMRIESIIKSKVPSYGYGSRREDQTKIICQSKLFGPVIHIDSQVIHKQGIDQCIEAWKSHATLERQAGKSFYLVIDEIESFLRSEVPHESIDVPYTTNIWMAQLK